MMNSKYILLSFVVVFTGIIATSCKRDGNDPGIQYAPEMYESIPYEAFKQVRDSVTPLPNGETMQTPPEGTIARGGHAAFEYSDTMRTSPEVINLKNPVPLTPEVLAEGEILYQRFCGICHGKSGKGDGSVAKHDAINPLSYDSEKLKNYSAGQIYHTIMYGQGAMGSYSSQLEYDERWKVVHFVQTLQGKPAENEDTPEMGDGNNEGNTDNGDGEMGLNPDVNPDDGSHSEGHE